MRILNPILCALAALALAGCVAYPAPYYSPYGYSYPGYYGYSSPYYPYYGTEYYGGAYYYGNHR